MTEDFETVRVDGLKGPQLNWAVAQIEASADVVLVVNGISDRYAYVGAESSTRRPWVHNYSPSTSWEFGGPIIERRHIAVWSWSDEKLSDCTQWSAAIGLRGTHPLSMAVPTGCGPTPLVAAMRALVNLRYGNLIEVPK